MRIGLFGGTFDPVHAAHRAASLLAMKRIGLDRVWWLVTPGNPLKDTRGLAPLEERLAAARALAQHPRIDVTGIEAQIGTHYSYETIAYLVRHSLAAGDQPIVIEQGVEMLRPSRIHVQAASAQGRVTNVRVGGRTIPIASGRLFLP